MKDFRINTNYAKALYDTAEELNRQDIVRNDATFINSLCESNHELNVILANPTIAEWRKVALLSNILSERVDELTLRFVTLITKKRRAINLRGIASAYLALYRAKHNILLVTVETAYPIDKETESKIKQHIIDRTHCDVELVNKINPKVLGGFCISYDNNRLDYRISTQLDKLRSEFSRNDYEKRF